MIICQSQEAKWESEAVQLFGAYLSGTPTLPHPVPPSPHYNNALIMRQSTPWSEGAGHRCRLCWRTCASCNDSLGAGSKAEARNPSLNLGGLPPPLPLSLGRILSRLAVGTQWTLPNGTEYKQNYLPQKSSRHAFTCVECLLTLEVVMSEGVLPNVLGNVRGAEGEPTYSMLLLSSLLDKSV